MIKDDKFLKLRSELSKSVVVIEKRNNGYNLCFDCNSNYQVFRQNLGHLHHELLKEISDNLLIHNFSDEVKMYMEMILQGFEMLDEQIMSLNNFRFYLNGDKVAVQSDLKPYQVTISMTDFQDLLACLDYEKKIIHQSRKFIASFLDGFKKYKGKNKPLILSWQDELKDFYPYMIWCKDELSHHLKLRAKINFLRRERIALHKELKKQGKDLYSSPLNFFFEVRIECIKDLLVRAKAEKKKGKRVDKEPDEVGIDKRSINSDIPMLKWTASKISLVELIYGLYCSESIEEGRAGIKNISELFETMFGIELGDIYHIFAEIKNRKINPTKFLDQLTKALNKKISENL